MQPSFIYIAELDQIVRRHFNVEGWLLEGGVPTYIVQPAPDLEARFRRLYSALSTFNLAPVLRREAGRLVLRLMPVARRRRRLGGRGLAVALFIATLGTILGAGYVVTVLDPLLRALDEAIALNPTPHLMGYAASMIGIVGVHELGHKLACRAHGVKASPPYFIPFPPIPMFPVGTLGAVITQESPPLTKDELFDLGIMGPFFGFVASLAVSIVGLSLSYPVPQHMVKEVVERGVVLPIPVIYHVLIPFLRPDLARASLIALHPIAWAGWVGFLVTFLNTFPVGQLDGGHVLRALLSEKLHFMVSAIFVALMFIVGFWAMALLAAFLALRGHPGALNEATPLSLARKLGILGLFAMWVASLPVPLMLLF